MVTLLYHARSNGAICRRIAAASNGAIQAVCDREALGVVDGTLVRWDSKVEAQATHTINSAEAVRLSRNKRESRRVLAGLCPPTWIKRGDCQFPCVVRPRRHFGGNDFYLCNNAEELRVATQRCGGLGRWYASAFVEKVNEYRVFILNGEAFKVIRRWREDNDPRVAWNFHNGGRSQRVKSGSWPTEVVEVAEEAIERLGLHLAAVDVIVDAEGKAFVLEANTAPGLERPKTIKRFAELLGEMA